MKGSTGSTDGVTARTTGEGETPFVLEEARVDGSARARRANLALIALSRAARSFLLYDPSNAAVRRFIDDLRTKMGQAVGGEPLKLEVRPFELALDNEVVYLEKDREHSLAFRMYRDGVRRLTLGADLAWDELLRLLEILSVRFTGVRQNEDDLVTLLWKAGFQHIEIEAVEGFAAEGDDARDRGARDASAQAPDDWDLPARAFAGAAEPTWREVHDSEREALCAEEASHLLSANAAQSALTLLDYAADPSAPIALEDVGPFVAEVRDFLLAEGQLAHLTTLVRVLQMHAESDRERLAPLIASFGDRRALSQILHSTPKVATAPPVELVELFDLLPADRLSRLIDLLRTERGEAPRRLLRQLIERYAAEGPEMLVRALKTAEPAVTCDLLRALAGALPERAIEVALELALHTDVSVVSEAFRRMEDAQPSPRVARTLLRMLDSPLEEIHLRVLDLLGTRYGALVFDPLVRSTEARCTARTLSEQEAEAIGRTLARLAPGPALTLFEQWLRPRKLIARLVESEGRWQHEWVAVSGLGSLRSDRAEPLIRETAARAGTELRRYCLATLARRRHQGDLYG